MSVCQSTFITRTQAQIDSLTSSCCAESIFEAAIAGNSVCTNRQFSVALACDLPDLATKSMAGTMVYVEEFGIPLIATATAWKGLDGRTYRSDASEVHLYSWGANCSSVLAFANSTNSSSPVREYHSATNWSFVDMARESANALKTDGTLWGAGGGVNGLAAGDGVKGQAFSYKQEFCCDQNWCQVSTNPDGNVTHAVKKNGTLWGWGNNVNGYCIPYYPAGQYCSPIREISSGTDWCFAHSAFNAGAAIKTNGTLWTWGCANNGVTAQNNTTVCYSSPVQEISSSTNWTVMTSGNNMISARKTDGTIWSWGTNYGNFGSGNTTHSSSPVQECCSATNWCSVSQGYRYALSLKTDGTMWFSGAPNHNGVLNYSPSGSNIYLQELTSGTTWCYGIIACKFALGIKTDGTLWGWGCNLGGQLATNNTICYSSPVQEITSATDWCLVSSHGCSIAGLKAIA